MEPTKNKVVKTRETPKTPMEVRQLLGLTGYYRRFIVNFYKIFKPLTVLTQKEMKFD